MPLYCKKVSYAWYALAYVRNERYAYVWRINYELWRMHYELWNINNELWTVNSAMSSMKIKVKKRLPLETKNTLQIENGSLDFVEKQ